MRRNIPRALVLGTLVVALSVAAPSVGAAPSSSEWNPHSHLSSPAATVAWPKLHFDAANTGFNPNETVLNASNVASLHTIWHFVANSLVQSTPAESNGVIYVGSQDHHLYALNGSTGKQIWSYETRRRVLVSSPAVAGSLVYVTDQSNTLYAINATSGLRQWKVGIGGSELSSPSVVNGVLYLPTSTGSLYALNASTGSKKWQFISGAGQPLTMPAVAGSYAYTGSSDGHVYAVNLSNGQLAWSFATTLESTSAPAVANGIVYVGAGHFLWAINATRGTKVWRARVATLDVDASPAVANGSVFIGTEDGNFYAFEASNGSGLWSAATGQPFGDTVPAVANGVVYTKTGGKSGGIFAFDVVTGDQLWTRALDGLSSPIVVNGMIYAGSGHDHRVYAFGIGP